MKIWTISDTHCEHRMLNLPDPKDIDVVIHAGDAGGHRELSINDAQIRDFLEWFESLPYKYKIYVPGNHDTSIANGFHDFTRYPSVILLDHKSIEIEGVKIFGSPYTPSFGHGWAYNVARHKIGVYWDEIPDDIDIVVTHGPPKGILDTTVSRDGSIQKAGCASLLNNIKRTAPKYHIFGHFHDESGVLNCGKFTPVNSKTTYINTCVMNLKYQVVNNGNIIEYED